jgi:hypothetical protein
MDGLPEIHTFITFAYGVRLAIRLQRRKSLADLFAMASSLSCFNTFHILTGWSAWITHQGTQSEKDKQNGGSKPKRTLKGALGLKRMHLEGTQRQSQGTHPLESDEALAKATTWERWNIFKIKF